MCLHVYMFTLPTAAKYLCWFFLFLLLLSSCLCLYLYVLVNLAQFLFMSVSYTLVNNLCCDKLLNCPSWTNKVLRIESNLNLNFNNERFFY